MNCEKFERDVESTALHLLGLCVSDDYAADIWSRIKDDVVADVYECSGYQAGEGFSDSDVRFAIGRALCDRIGVYEEESNEH